MSDHTGHPPTTIKVDGYSEPVYTERLKSSLADLAREVQIQTQRATAAESALASLRGEVVVLREMYSQAALDCEVCRALSKSVNAPHAASLGALVAAALEVADAQIHYRELPSEEHFRRLNTLVFRADAVLAAMGKEGAGQ